MVAKSKESILLSLLLRFSKHMFFEDGFVSDVTIIVISTRSNISDISFKQIFCCNIHYFFSYVLLIPMKHVAEEIKGLQFFGIISSQKE